MNEWLKVVDQLLIFFVFTEKSNFRSCFYYYLGIHNEIFKFDYKF